MRTKQRINNKNNKNSKSNNKFVDAELVIIRPAGYPLKGSFHDYPEPSNMDVFECYARQQWNGIVVKDGDFLFDKRMFPDFAFKVERVEPNNSIITNTTEFIFNDYEIDFFEPEIKKKSDITFKDIIGQEKAKEKCKVIKKFFSNPSKFGKWIPKNILFYGPPGTGKTMTAQALANSLDIQFISVKATKLIGEFVGDGARQIHQLYEKAEEFGKCIVFIDEFDAIALNRNYQELRGDVSEIVNALLTEMDGIDEHKAICTIAATNMLEMIDIAIRSRFEQEIEFTLPDEKERLKIIRHYIKTFPVKIKKPLDLKKIAQRTEGFSGRDLVEKLLKGALYKAIISGKKVNMSHFEEVLKELSQNKEKIPERMYI